MLLKPLMLKFELKYVRRVSPGRAQSENNFLLLDYFNSSYS